MQQCKGLLRHHQSRRAHKCVLGGKGEGGVVVGGGRECEM